MKKLFGIIFKNKIQENYIQHLFFSNKFTNLHKMKLLISNKSQQGLIQHFDRKFFFINNFKKNNWKKEKTFSPLVKLSHANFSTNNKITNEATKPVLNSSQNQSKKEIQDSKNKNLTKKLDTVFQNEYNEKVNNQIENKFVLDKLKNLNKFYRYIRFPIFAIILPFAWMNPFSAAYSYTLLATNNYMIFLTLLESSIFFSAGLTHFLINTENYSLKKNLLSVRDLRNFKRLATGFFNFSFILLSAVLANNYLNHYSLILLLINNLYIYVKYSYHIFLKMFSKEIFTERMVMVIFNAGTCALLLIIISWKNNIHSMLV